MEYTTDKKAFLIGVALGLALHGQRRADLGRFMNKHTDIFKDIISGIITGDITYDYQIKVEIEKLAISELGYENESDWGLI